VFAKTKYVRVYNITTSVLPILVLIRSIIIHADNQGKNRVIAIHIYLSTRLGTKNQQRQNKR